MSVLPEPVGAQISVLSPEAIAGQPLSWAGVGASNDASNQRLTGAENGCKSSGFLSRFRGHVEPTEST